MAATEASTKPTPNPGHGADGDRDREIGQATTGTGDNSAVPGLRPVPHRECGSQHALPLLVPQSSKADAEQRQELGDQGSPAYTEWNPQDLERGSRSNVEISLYDQDADGRPGQSTSLSLDSAQPLQWRNLASPAQLVLSQHLAACEIDFATANTTAERTGEAGAKASLEGDRLAMVRILLNRTGTVCFVNALLNALTWLTMLCRGLVPDCWRHGYALMRSLTLGTHIPVDVLSSEPFRWLITGSWEMKDLLTQQDTIDFGHFFLLRTSPSFLSCSWMTRIHHAIGEDHPHLNSEKGFQFAPIRIPFLNFQDNHSSINQLITAWHDAEGLCRAVDKVRNGLVLMLDRHIDGQSVKCLQRVELEPGMINFPCFDHTGAVINLPFQICAVGFHLGLTPHSGHYRSALRYRGHWLVYE